MLHTQILYRFLYDWSSSWEQGVVAGGGIGSGVGQTVYPRAVFSYSSISFSLSLIITNITPT